MLSYPLLASNQWDDVIFFQDQVFSLRVSIANCFEICLENKKTLRIYQNMQFFPLRNAANKKGTYNFNSGRNLRKLATLHNEHFLWQGKILLTVYTYNGNPIIEGRCKKGEDQLRLSVRRRHTFSSVNTVYHFSHYRLIRKRCA